MNKSILLLGFALAGLMGLTETVHAQTTATPYTSATRYDQLGRVAGTISPNDAPRGYQTFLAIRTSYDSGGRPYKVETGRLDTWQSEQVLPENWGPAFFAFTTIETTYNTDNQKLTEVVKGSNLLATSLTQYSYDAAGRLECTALRMNTAAYGNLPTSACTLGTEGTQGPDRITRNVYDAADQLVQIREGVGTTVEAGEVTYSYTDNGKMEYVIDAGGHKARKCYDTFDRQSRWVFPSQINPSSYNDSTVVLARSTAGAVNGGCTGTTGDYEEYGYDPNGNRTSLRKRDNQSITYQYDQLNRNIVKIVPGSTPSTRDVYYSYDLRDLMTSALFDSTSGEGVTFEYDGYGRKISETLTMDGVPRTLGSQYDRDGNRIRLTYPDTNYVDYLLDGLDRLYYSSLNGVDPLFRTSFESAGRLSAIMRRNTVTDAWGALTGYSYDAVSRISTMSQDPAGTSYDIAVPFAYNAANQITSRTATNSGYSWIGYLAANPTYVANGLNQYSNIAGVAYAYDANGNLISDGAQAYTYDVENRLITRISASSSADLRYDPLGRLYEVKGIEGNVTTITRFLYDGDQLVAEYSDGSPGTLLRRYVHGMAAGDDPLVWFEGSSVSDSARRYLHPDERGSIVAVTDQTGTISVINAYDEHGITDVSGNDLATRGRFRYTGQVYIQELGLYHYKARMYSPRLGRFMQTDPIGYDGQFNLYGYTSNDPINFLDFAGQQSGPSRPAPPPMGHNLPPRSDPITVPALARIERRIVAMDPTYKRPQVVGSLSAKDVAIAQQNLRDRSVLGFGGSQRGENLNDAAMHIVLGRSEYGGPSVGGSSVTYQYKSSGDVMADFTLLTGGNFTTRDNGALVSGRIELGNGNEVVYNVHNGTGVGRDGAKVLQATIRSTLPGSRIVRSTTFKIQYTQ